MVSLRSSVLLLLACLCLTGYSAEVDTACDLSLGNNTVTRCMELVMGLFKNQLSIGIAWKHVPDGSFGEIRGKYNKSKATIAYWLKPEVEGTSDLKLAKLEFSKASASNDVVLMDLVLSWLKNDHLYMRLYVQLTECSECRVLEANVTMKFRKVTYSRRQPFRFRTSEHPTKYNPAWVKSKVFVGKLIVEFTSCTAGMSDAQRHLLSEEVSDGLIKLSLRLLNERVSDHTDNWLATYVFPKFLENVTCIEKKRHGDYCSNASFSPAHNLLFDDVLFDDGLRQVLARVLLTKTPETLPEDPRITKIKNRVILLKSSGHRCL